MNETLKSSASSAEAGVAESTQDANSSANSSTADQGAKKPAPTLKDHLFTGESSIQKQMAAEEDSPASDKIRKTDDGSQSNEPAKAGEDGAADPNAAAEENKPLSAEEEAKLPFHKHPRWQQMKKENAEVREKLSSLEPRAKAYDDFVGKVTDAKLGAQDLDELLNVGKTLKHDPNAAYDYLVDYVGKLGVTIGRTLPADLKKRVEEGYLTEEDAARLAKAEAIKDLTIAEKQQQEEADRAKLANGEKTAKKTALSSWEFDWKSKDPDYAILQPDVEDRFLRLARETPPKTAEDIVTLANKALADVRTRRKMPPPKAVKPPVQSGASVQTLAVPKTMKESILQAGRAGNRS